MAYGGNTIPSTWTCGACQQIAQSSNTLRIQHTIQNIYAQIFPHGTRLHIHTQHWYRITIHTSPLTFGSRIISYWTLQCHKETHKRYTSVGTEYRDLPTNAPRLQRYTSNPMERKSLKKKGGDRFFPRSGPAICPSPQGRKRRCRFKLHRGC